MKEKLLLSPIVFLFVTPVIGQEQVSGTDGADFPTEERFLSATRKEHIYNYGNQLLKKLGTGSAGVSRFYYYLFPDSTVVTNITSGAKASTHHSGNVLDPTADLYWEDEDAEALPDNLSYHLDGINLYYRYFRPQNQVPDTLFVQVYSQNAMELFPTAFTNPQRPYARLYYDQLENMGKNHTKLITILLEDNFVATSISNMYIPVDLDIAAGQKVAYSIFYKPGNPYNEGDTIQFDANAVNQRNAFIGYCNADNTFYKEDGKYNHGLVVNTSVRYNENPNGWNGRFIPGVAFVSSYRHYDADFLVNSTVGISHNSKNKEFIMAPNPIKVGNNLKISGLSGAEPIKIRVLDLTGKELMDSLFLPGNSRQSIEINTSNLKPGVYFIAAENGDMPPQVKKLVVTQ